MIKYGIFIFFWVVSQPIWAQNKVYGFRGGLSYARPYGPSERNQQGQDLEHQQADYGYFFSFTSRYIVNDNFGVRTEMGYQLLHSQYAYNGPAFRIFKTDNGEKIYANGQLQLNMSLNNGYFTVPILCYYQLDDSPFEWAAGLQFEVLLYSKSKGSMQFEGQTANGTAIPAFNTAIDFNYIYDDSAKVAYYKDIFIEENGRKGRVPSHMGAYTEWQSKPDKYFRKVTSSAVFDLNFHVSDHFSIGLRTCFGLLDATSNNADFNRQSLDNNNKPITRRDFDRYISAIASVALEF